jgi:hypothetical protein
MGRVPQDVKSVTIEDVFLKGQSPRFPFTNN